MTEAPQQFGKYRILGELGRGGFATVFRAVDTTLEREVALKILYPQMLADPTFVQRFRQEARTLAALRHPQIVTVYEAGEAEGRLFIAMDLVNGPSLAQSIARRGRVPWGEALDLLRPVCEVLDYAHGQGVVHRDLKPANILLDRQRGALLTDFGFARLIGESSVILSMSGGVLGTPGYIAPEVWDGSAAEAPADIYALGCIVYEVLTGETLFRGQTPMQVMRAHDRGPAFPEAWPDGVPVGIGAVLGKALARDPDRRFANAGALWQALNGLKAPGPVVPPDKTISRRSPILAFGGAAALVLAVGIALIARGGGISPPPTGTGTSVGQVAITTKATATPATSPSIGEPTEAPATAPLPVVTAIPAPTAIVPPMATATPTVVSPTAAPTPTTVPATPTPTAGIEHKEQIVFAAASAQRSGIYLANADGSELQQLVDNGTSPVWSPNGTQIAFMVRGAGWEIYVMNADGSGLHKIADGTGPRWSPDGRQIVFEAGDIYVVNTDGSDRNNLTSTEAGDFKPSWSSSGTIAFDAAHPDGNKIYSIEADGTNLRQLTSGSGNDHAPIWSPNGGRIAFISLRVGFSAIYIMNADGDSQRQLTKQSGICSSAGSIAWSPDGSAIAFSSYDGTSNTICVINTDGTGLRQLAAGVEPAWSSDGRQIAFTSRESGRAAIVVMNDDGSNQRQIAVDTELDYYAPAWSP
jgi:serine/threonine protein kinase/Tol biopolymer transport system component